MLPFDKEYDRKCDATLAELICKGSPEALQLFLSIHQQFIYNVALRMLNSQQSAGKLTQEFMVRLLLNIRGASDCENITLWIYRRLIGDIRKILSVQPRTITEQFTQLADLIGQESTNPRMSEAMQAQFSFEIEAVTNTCLTNMAACLPVEERFIFVLVGIFNVPEPSVAAILEIPLDTVVCGLQNAKALLAEFTSHNCSVFGHDNACTCDKRTNHYLAQDNPIEFFNDVNGPKRKKICELIADHKEASDIAPDELTALYRNQPFINTNSVSEGLSVLCKKPDLASKEDHLLN